MRLKKTVAIAAIVATVVAGILIVLSFFRESITIQRENELTRVTEIDFSKVTYDTATPSDLLIDDDFEAYLIPEYQVNRSIKSESKVNDRDTTTHTLYYDAGKDDLTDQVSALLAELVAEPQVIETDTSNRVVVSTNELLVFVTITPFQSVDNTESAKTLVTYAFTEK